MKRMMLMAVLFLMVGLFSSIVNAEERAFNNDKPRNCSGITDAKKKARCEAFNKALSECKSEGKKVGKGLDACLMEKGKKK